MAKYFVTGTAGFIGCKVSEMLLRQGHEVIGVDNLNDAYDVRLKHWRLEKLLNFSRFVFKEVDITDCDTATTIAEHVYGADAIINFAARAGVRQSFECPRVYVDTNVTGTLNLLELCRRQRIKKFVLASTSSLYGSRNPRPFREDADTSCPLTPYAASKKGAEALCYSYHSMYGVDISILRYFTVYGPAGRPDMLPFRLVQWISEGRPVTIYGDGKQERDFTFVDDISEGTIAALRPLGFEIINLGSDQPIRIEECVKLVESLVGKSASLSFKERHPADVFATWADIGKAKSLLSWQPHTRYQQGFRALVEWYEQHRSWASEISTVQ